MDIFKIVRRGDITSLSMWINNGGNVNIRDNFGSTLLHVACCYQKEDCVELLIRCGADIHLCSGGGYGNSLSPLHTACWKGNKYCTELLIKNGANINSRSTDGFTPLHTACIYGKKDCAELLINSGANIYIKCNSGKTPFKCIDSKNFRKYIQQVYDNYTLLNIKEPSEEE